MPSLPSVSLPETDHTITRVGLGGMPLSLRGRPDREAAKAVIRSAVEEGMTLIDTADVYSLDHTDIGHNERLVAESLGDMGLSVGHTSSSGPSPMVVATKGGRTRPDGRWEHDGRPESIKEACHSSLRALGVERITLYQLHSPDPAVDFEDTVGAFARLREQGKVEAVGLSNVTVKQIEKARTLVPVTAVQNAFSPWDVGLRRPPVVEHCRRAGILFLAYSPLGGSSRAKELSASPEVRAVADELGASAQELALAWLLHQSPVVVAIPGATRQASVKSSARAATQRLDDRTLRRLTKAFRTLPGNRGLLARVGSRLARSVGR